MARYVITNNRREILVLVDFQDDYHSINYWIIYLVSILRCYDLKLKELSDKTTLVLSNTRELNRVPSTK